MRNATKDYLALHPLDPQRAEAADTRTTRGTKNFELQAAHERLEAAARKFFLRSHELQVLPPHLLARVEELLPLGLEIEPLSGE
jgi:hypothetical protein